MANPCPHGNVYDVNCGRCGELHLAREEGRRDERADMAAWLRNLRYCWFAACIERGEHVGAAAKGRKP